MPLTVRASRRVGTVPAAPGLLTVSGDELHQDGQPVRLWGVRAASASTTADMTTRLIAALDSWTAVGINAVTVFFQGSSGGNARAFNSSGTAFDSGHLERMVQIADATQARGMVLIVGLYYQSATRLADAAAYDAGARLAAASLAGYPHVIINIANENNSGGWSTAPLNFNDSENVLALCQAVHDVDPDRLVGGGGYEVASNNEIGVDPRADLLLFDTFQTRTATYYTVPARTAGTTKPMINVETFGGSTRDIDPTPGVYTDEWKKPTPTKGHYIREVDEVLSEDIVGTFIHDNRWFQMFSLGGSYTMEDNRFDLGDDGAASQGTSASPGWAWWPAYIQSVT